MIKSKTILLTGGGGAGNEAIWRILNDKYNLYFADCDLDNVDSAIPSDRRLAIPKACDDNFTSSLVQICNKLKVDFLVPGVDEELLILQKNKALFDCKIFLPEYSFIAGMLDKHLCAKSIASKGLLAPETYYVSDYNKLDFPMVIKPKSGRGSRGVMIVHSEEELQAYKVFNKLPDTDIIAQQLISGQEFTVLVSANKEQELNCIVPIKVAQKKGITISATTEMNDSIIDYVRSFHKNFKTDCIYNLQCILTDDNRVYPFEVNPRVSTTFCVVLAAGFDPFEMFYSNEKFVPKHTYSLRRNWKNNITSDKG